ncbi:MAG: rhodanese-like domain-containing protein [Planctomycetota bacterium]|nr:MAG: rhodanese-like domain-containing protein [Planctomycetota bacterium]
MSGWKAEGGRVESTPPKAGNGEKVEKTEKPRTPAFAEIAFAELQPAVEAGKLTVIDVNGLDSYTAGHIPGALHFASIEKDFAAKLPKDKSAPIVAYCGGPTCNAWKRAADAAAKLGYTNVKHYKGGISGWKTEGGRIEVVKP